MPDTTELTGREFLMEELKLPATVIAAITAIVREPLEVEERSAGLYALVTEGASPLHVLDLVKIFGEEPVCSFIDRDPPDEDDCYSILAVFAVESTDGETYAVSVRVDHGAGACENHAFVDIVVPSEEERGTRAAVTRTAKALEIDILRKSWGWFAEVAAECRHAALSDILPEGGVDAQSEAAIALVDRLRR